jgi:hypothetical protein
VIDLAVTPPLLTIFAADKDDIRNDIPSLAVGDFNGDDVDDLLVGARFGDGPDNSREDGGEAYVILGSHNLAGIVDLASGQQDLTIFGAKPGDSLGYSVAAADVNADGLDDIIVSSPFSEGPLADLRTDRGEVYVIFGRPDLNGRVDIAEGQQDLTIVGAEGFSLVGDSIAAGDVNGDGTDDMVLGAPFAGRVPGSPHGGPRTYLGETYVVFGSPDLGGTISIPKGQQDVRVSGPSLFSELGDAVAVGDVNGDGIDDLILAAEAGDGPNDERPNAGDAYVIFGSRHLPELLDLAQGQQDLTIHGRQDDGALGFCVSSGDVNGDKIDDILLVAQRADGLNGARQTSGEAYLILGSHDLGGTVDTLKDAQDVTIAGAEAHDLLSACYADADINSDGVGDVMLGTGFGRGPDNARDLAGEAYIISGSHTWEPNLDLATSAREAIFYAAEAAERFGAAVWAGDLNGDGRMEVIAAAPEGAGPDNSRPGAGEIYIVTPPRPGG